MPYYKAAMSVVNYEDTAALNFINQFHSLTLFKSNETIRHFLFANLAIVGIM